MQKDNDFRHFNLMSSGPIETAIPTPIQPWQNARTPSAKDICVQMCNQVEYMSHAHYTSTKAELAEYHHQNLFSPPEVTRIQAIKNEQLKVALAWQRLRVVSSPSCGECRQRQ